MAAQASTYVKKERTQMDQEKTPNTNPETPQEEERNRLIIVRSPIMEIKSGYVLRQVGQAYMIMPTGPRMKDYEGMITLNETGAFLFKEMQKPDPTIEKLEAACISEYGATPEEAGQAVTAFLNQCVGCGLMDYTEKIYDQDGHEITEEELKHGRNE